MHQACICVACATFAGLEHGSFKVNAFTSPDSSPSSHTFSIDILQVDRHLAIGAVSLAISSAGGSCTTSIQDDDSRFSARVQPTGQRTYPGVPSPEVDQAPT